MTRLTARKVQTVRDKGEYLDGKGLFLRVTSGGSKSWYVRLTVHGRQKKIGLGSIDYMGLAEAREEAMRLRGIARRGEDPSADRLKQTLTFSEAACRVHEGLVPTWRNKKHAASWLASVENCACPAFGSRPIETIGSADILGVLAPIWTEKPETAKRLKQRLSTIFDWAKGAGHYPHENPVNGVKRALPVVKRRPEHLAALDWQSVPAFFAELSDRSAMSARALELIILTACRSGEVRGARWTEIEERVWTIPGERMKRGLPHRVPLSNEALATLERVRGLDPELLFPSPKRTRSQTSQPLSVMAFKPLLTRMGKSGFTVHGFRSSFRDWCSETAGVPRELAEAALAHATGSEVERAYARSDLLEQRRELMEAWARFVTGDRGDVVQFRKA